MISRGVYVSNIVGPHEYAQIYKEETGTYKLLISTTKRSGSFMAETALSLFVGLLEQIILHPTSTYNVVLCLKNNAGTFNSDELKIFVPGRDGGNGPWEFTGLIGFVSIDGNNVNVELEHSIYKSGSHFLLHRDGSFELNGNYKTNIVNNEIFGEVKCN